MLVYSELYLCVLLLAAARTACCSDDVSISDTPNSTSKTEKQLQADDGPEFVNLGYYSRAPRKTYSCGKSDIQQNLFDQGWRPPRARIFGGIQATYGAYPWLAIIVKKVSGNYKLHCGAGVVSKHTIVTAAHCVDGQRRSDFRVRLAEFNIKRKDHHEISYDVDHWVIHPQWTGDGQWSNDLALVFLKPKTSPTDAGFYSQHIRHLCVPQPSTDFTGTSCRIAGFGLTGTYDTFPARLQAAAVKVLPWNTCRRKDVLGGGPQKFTKALLCAGYLEGQVDTCTGDSGGPLMCLRNGRWFVAGVVSGGYGCGERNHPGVYTKLSHYSSWIRETVRKYSVK